MKLRFISFFGLAPLVLSAAATASDVGRLMALSFTDGNRPRIQQMISSPNICAEVLRIAIAAHAARIRSLSADPVASVRVIDGCQVMSFNHDGSLEIVSTADLENGNGPLSYVALYKRSGVLDEADVPVGEGNGGLGPVKLFLEDIKHDGRLELIEKSRVTNAGSHNIANVDPAPTVTHIYVWRNNSFVLSTVEFRNYISEEVLPALRKQQKDIGRSSPMAPRRKKEAQAIDGSIMLANRFLDTGHYFPGSSKQD